MDAQQKLHSHRRTSAQKNMQKELIVLSPIHSAPSCRSDPAFLAGSQSLDFAATKSMESISSTSSIGLKMTPVANGGHRQKLGSAPKVPRDDDSDHFMIYLPDSNVFSVAHDNDQIRTGVTCLLVIRQRTRNATRPELVPGLEGLRSQQPHRVCIAESVADIATPLSTSSQWHHSCL